MTSITKLVLALSVLMVIVACGVQEASPAPTIDTDVLVNGHGVSPSLPAPTPSVWAPKVGPTKSVPTPTIVRTPSPTHRPTPMPSPTMAPQPTATATPTAIPTVTPSATPTPPPTPTPTPTPTPSPTPTPEPTPTATPGPTPTPSPPLPTAPENRGWNVLGDPEAPVTLVKFGDFQCSTCRRWAEETGEAIRKTYIQQGQVKLVYRHFIFFGYNSRLLAMGTECAGEQGSFWHFHDRIYRDGPQNREGMLELAGTLGLNVSRFTACVEEERYAKAMEDDISFGEDLEVNYLPTFLIHNADQWTIWVGASGIEAFGPALDEFLP